MSRSRSATEEALRQSEERYRSLAESTTDMIYITDRDGVILYANRSAAACYGGDASSVVGKRQEDLFPPEMVQKHMASIVDVFQTGRVFEADGAYRFGSEEVWLNNRLVPLRDERGEVTAVIGVSRNVTDRKQAEAALKQAHDELEKRVEERTAELARAKREWEWTFDSVPDLIAVLDRSSRIVRVNRAMAERLAIRPEQCVGLRCCEPVHGLSEPPEFCPNALTLADGKGHAAEIHEDRLGGDFLVTTTPIFDENNQLIGSVHVARDITEQKRAQKALQESEEKYRGLVDICPDAIVVSDLTGRATFVSPQTWRLLSVPEEEKLLGRSTLDYVIEPDRPRLAARITSLLQVGKQEHTEYTVLRPDGTTLPVELSSALIRDAEGGPIALMAIIRDVSERKRAEESLKKEHRTLRHLLESSDHERRLIAYDIHDGLAQQLAGAIMQLDTYYYQKDAKPLEAAHAYDAALTMLRQAHFETRRLISGVRPPILDESGIVAAVAHLVNEHRLQSGPTIEFRSEVCFDRLVPVLENAIYRIVQEGLANACKHSKSPKIRVELVQHEDALRIKVQDWGVGFDPGAVRDDRFGLEGIRERARLLGGKANVETVPQQGTCLTVELPLAFRKESE